MAVFIKEHLLQPHSATRRRQRSFFSALPWAARLNVEVLSAFILVLFHV